MTTLGRTNFSLMKHCIRNSLFETRCVVPMTRNAHTKETHPTKYDENINAKCRMRGIGILRDPKLNKGTAFTIRERQIYGIHGLLPPDVKTIDEQLERVRVQFESRASNIDKYIYLSSLQDRNEKLFYKFVTQNIEETSPIIYTPTVGLACQKFGSIFRRPRGLYITINDLGHIYDILCNWPETDVKAVVVTDGERILGLGDLGTFGMGIPIGKLSLYTALGGVPPEQCLPVCLDVGTDNEKLRNDPVTYMGLRHKRVRGEKYDQLIDEFMQAIVKRYGQGTLIQFEDFANANAFRLLEKYRSRYLTFNDDIQGTAAVAVAGLIASMKKCGTRLADHKYLFQGAGEASIGIANLLVMALQEEGMSVQDARDRIWMVDSKGLLTFDRPGGGITEHKKHFAKKYKHIAKLEDVCREIKPTAAIGAAAIAGAFTDQFIRDMATYSKQPIIFALSNPTDKAECTAQKAYELTDGRAIFASGSPFAPVTIKGKTFYPGQGNNSYIFPGVGLAAISADIRHITDAMFLKAAQAVAELVTQADLDEGRVYPPLSKIRETSTHLSTRLIEFAYKEKLAFAYPEPADKGAFIKQHQYSPEYDDFMPEVYEWPEEQ